MRGFANCYWLEARTGEGRLNAAGAAGLLVILFGLVGLLLILILRLGGLPRQDGS